MDREMDCYPKVLTYTKLAEDGTKEKVVITMLDEGEAEDAFHRMFTDCGESIPYSVDEYYATPTSVIDCLREKGPGLGGVVMLQEPNTLCHDTPCNTPLLIVGEGVGSQGITYKVAGWDDIGTDDPYYLLKGAGLKDLFLMRKGHPHTPFYSEASIQHILDSIDPSVDGWLVRDEN